MAENGSLEKRKKLQRQIKEQVNILDVIGKYYTLTDVPRGKKEPKVLSIEEAKTKQTVSTQEHDSIRVQTQGKYANTYKRWSTGDAGNVFDFLINEIGMTFNEAMKELEPMIDPTIDPSKAAKVNQQAFKEKQWKELSEKFEKHLINIVKTKLKDDDGKYSISDEEVANGFRWIQQAGLKYPDFKWNLVQQWKDCYDGLGVWSYHKDKLTSDDLFKTILKNPGEIIMSFISFDRGVYSSHINKIVSSLEGTQENKDVLFREIMELGWRSRLHVDLANEISKDTQYRNVFAYLIQERKLSERIVKQLYQTGVLAQEKQFDNTIFAVFLDRNKYGLIERINKKPANLKAKQYKNYPFEKGEEGVNKGMLLDFHNNGYRGMSPNAHEKQLFVFEAYIDMVSFMDIQQRNGVDINQNAYLSLGGAGKGNGLFERLKDAPYKSVNLCLDNDGKGADGAITLNKRLELAGIPCEFYISKTKDWNEDLQKGFTGNPEPTIKEFQISKWKELYPKDVEHAFKSIGINQSNWKKEGAFFKRESLKKRSLEEVKEIAKTRRSLASNSQSVEQGRGKGEHRE